MAGRSPFVTTQVLVMAALFCSCASQASAQWSAIGATAVVDEASVGKVVMNDTGSIAMAPRVVGTVQVRWQISPFTVADSTRDLCLRVRVRDLGATDRVVVRVREMTVFNGTVNTLATWDSNTAADFAGTPFEMEGNVNYRMGVVCPLRRGGQELREPEWFPRSYFVDATMTRTDATGNPGVMAIRIDSQF